MDAREPPSQLQEATEESTDVDTEYNLPTRVLNTRVDKTRLSTSLVRLSASRYVYVLDPLVSMSWRKMTPPSSQSSKAVFTHAFMEHSVNLQ
jgi:hypothetical protein